MTFRANGYEIPEVIIFGNAVGLNVMDMKSSLSLSAENAKVVICLQEFPSGDIPCGSVFLRVKSGFTPPLSSRVFHLAFQRAESSIRVTERLS